MFGLPDLRGRFPMHPGNGPGRTSRRLGEKGGNETHLLTAAQMPNHSHPTQAYSGAANQQAPSSAHVFAREPANVTALYSDQTPDTTLLSVSAGGGQAHSIMNPFLTVNFLIALQGTFPSRS